jgi:hypothetical protein
MGMISLIAIDLDGTLLTTEKSLAAEGADLLRQAYRRGVYVILTTARNPDSVRRYCLELGIDHPIICSNGAQVWGSPEGPVWIDLTMSRETALAIARYADAHDWEITTTIGSTTYLRQRPDQALGPLNPERIVVATNVDAVIGNPMRILVFEPDAIEGIGSFCRSTLAGQCSVETWYNADGTLHSLGIFPPNVEKGNALAFVLERLGIHKEQVMAIGDNFVDLSMFRYAAISVAMGNAPDEVKQQATVVAPDNDAEGVAWALRFYNTDLEKGSR